MAGTPLIQKQPSLVAYYSRIDIIIIYNNDYLNYLHNIKEIRMNNMMLIIQLYR